MKTETVHGVELLAENDRVLQDFQRKGLPTFEPQSMVAWLAAVGPGTVAIDVGAYTGLYAIAAARRGSRVLAIEPNGEVYQRLLHNCRHNGVDVTCVRAAAGVMLSRGKLVTNGARLTSASKVVIGSGEIKVVRVGSLVMPKMPVSAIKVDVEGAEVGVLMGAREVIERCKPLLIVEALQDRAREEVIEALSLIAPYHCEVADERNLVCRPA